MSKTRSIILMLDEACRLLNESIIHRSIPSLLEQKKWIKEYEKLEDE